MRRVFGLAVAAAVAVAAPAVVLAGANALEGVVGPDFNISLVREDGNRVITLDPGAYNLGVDDQSEFHSFHLRGPGVNAATGIDFIGVQDFDVALVEGRYEYFCDAHPVQMRGTFTVGNPPPVSPPPAPPSPPPPPAPRPPGRLTASVGPGAVIVLRRGRAKVASVRSGVYLITVADRSPTQNFHLVGPGVNRKTGIAARTVVTWRVTLRRGAVYRYRSDAQPTKLRGAFRAV